MKNMWLVLVLIVVLSLALSSCGDCTTGKIDNKYEQNGSYYMVLSVQEGISFTGETKTISVSESFYRKSNQGDVITHCD